LRRSYNVLCALALSLACGRATPERNGLEAALEGIEPDEIRAHMRFLADDLLEGRAPGTPGYAIAARYVATQLESMGLSPAGEDGTYYQRVPLRRASLEETGCSLAILDGGGRSTSLVFGEDYLLFPPFEAGDRETRASLVFAGYGISAPELGWDDFAEIDTKGTILVVLSGAPASFGSTERAFYSSRENKAAAAVARGAVGMLVIQTPVDEVRRPWSRTREFFSGSSMTWIDPMTGRPRSEASGLAASGMLGPKAARSLFAEAPVSLEAIFERSESDAGPPRFELGREAIIRSRSVVSDFESDNVVASLEGGKPERAREHVVFSSHLDHVGRRQSNKGGGDDIYNGAYDNASGSAALLAIARAFSKLEPRPDRSLVFLAVTAEEEGLLGSDYFARNPTVSGELIANVNMDGVLMFHPLHDFVAFGADHSTLREPVQKAAAMLGLKVSPDFMPEEVIFIRSDQYSFVRAGVPAVYAFVGTETGNPAIDGEKILREWMVTTYHKPTDDIKQEMDFEAGADYARLEFLIGALVANAAERPRWNEGDFLGEKFGR
jgi:Zn-dependent M28 family amino/carboxypeptidase